MLSASDVLPILSLTALSSTVAFFLCGIQICNRIRLRGSTEGTSPAPFLMAFLSCSLFILYGFLKNDPVIYITNSVGSFLQFLYISYYHRMTRNKRFLNKMLFLQFLVISMAIYFCLYSEEINDTKQTYIGNFCILLNIGSVAAPLFDIGKVVSSRSSESLPFPLCVASFVVCIQWMFYGYLVEDNVILVPNIIATIISALQLSLFVIYPSRSKYERFKNDEVENGSHSI